MSIASSGPTTFVSRSHIDIVIEFEVPNSARCDIKVDELVETFNDSFMLEVKLVTPLLYYRDPVVLKLSVVWEHICVRKTDSHHLRFNLQPRNHPSSTDAVNWDP